jgi:hypothetical protein
LIKDVVTACDTFDVNKFIPLLRERIRIKNPFIRQLLVGFVLLLLGLPDAVVRISSLSLVALVRAQVDHRARFGARGTHFYLVHNSFTAD